MRRVIILAIAVVAFVAMQWLMELLLAMTRYDSQSFWQRSLVAFISATVAALVMLQLLSRPGRRDSGK